MSSLLNEVNRKVFIRCLKCQRALSWSARADPDLPGYVDITTSLCEYCITDYEKHVLEHTLNEELTVDGVRATVLKQTRKLMLSLIKTLTVSEQHRFKQMYANGHLYKPIEDVIKVMPDEKLDWALKQIVNTIKAHERRETEAANVNS